MDFTFAELLRSFRQRASLDQATLATNLGTHRNTIGGWERGLYRPNDRELVLGLAVELALTPAETDQLLHAADFPSVHSTPSSLTARHQLRAPIADFTGRAAEMERLRAVLQAAPNVADSAVLCALRGMGGVGKTELAYRVVHDLRASFPGAQIVIALRGTSAEPLNPVQALQEVLRAFMPDVQLPTDLPALQRLYCSCLHNRRALILADDACDAAQVRPLIPPVGCALLVTTRQRFSLPGMTTIDLEPLNPDEAIAVLRQIYTWISATEAERLAQACGYLPLALRISGAILANDASVSVATYLIHLADVQHRLAQLQDPDDAQLDVDASLRLSYARLDASAQRVFRQLGVLVSDFSADLASAVIADRAVDVVSVLRQLLRRNLVQYDSGRACWQLHDLVRALALRLLIEVDELEATRWRYAGAAVDLAQTIEDQYQTGGAAALAALSRFDAERPHFDAARRWAADHAGTKQADLLLVKDATATSSIGELRYDLRHERIPQLEDALAAARRLDDRQNEGRTLNRLGIAHMYLGEFQQAIAYYEQRLNLAYALADQRGEAVALANLAMTYDALGNLQQAISAYEQSFAIMRVIEDRAGEGNIYGGLARIFQKLGDAEQAYAYAEHYLASARALGSQRDEGYALNNTGVACRMKGAIEQAIAYHTQALSIAQTIGDRMLESTALHSLGHAYEVQGDAQQAIDTSTQSLEIVRDSGFSFMEGEVLSVLGRVYARISEPIRAAEMFAQAMTLLQQAGDRVGVAECSWHYGQFLLRQGERERALVLLHAAVAYEQEIEHLHAEAHAALLQRLECGEALPLEIGRSA